MCVGVFTREHEQTCASACVCVRARARQVQCCWATREFNYSAQSSLASELESVCCGVAARCELYLDRRPPNVTCDERAGGKRVHADKQ